MKGVESYELVCLSDWCSKEKWFGCMFDSGDCFDLFWFLCFVLVLFFLFFILVLVFFIGED